MPKDTGTASQGVSVAGHWFAGVDALLADERLGFSLTSPFVCAAMSSLAEL